MSQDSIVHVSRKRSLQQADEEELEGWANLSYNEAFAEVKALRQVVFKEEYSKPFDRSFSRVEKMSERRKRSL